MRHPKLVDPLKYTRDKQCNDTEKEYSQSHLASYIIDSHALSLLLFNFGIICVS